MCIRYLLFMASALLFVLIVSGIYRHSSSQIICFLPQTNQYVLKTMFEGMFYGGGGEGSFGQIDIDR